MVVYRSTGLLQFGNKITYIAPVFLYNLIVSLTKQKQMRKTTFTFTLALVLIFTTAWVEAEKLFITPKVEFKTIITKIEIVETKPEIKVNTEILSIKDYNKFLNDIGFKESSNRYKVVNQYGYLGKYQFSRQTLNDIGFKHVSNREFLASPQIQEEAMHILLEQNKYTLRHQIKKYDGKIVNGVLITESGMLAAAHLAGAGNVKEWFKSGKEFKDGNGTKLTTYLKTFSDYKLNF